MRSFKWITLVFSCSAMLGLELANASELPSAKPVRVLLTYGGHPFEEAPFYAMLDTLPGIVYTKVEMPKAAELFKPGLEKDFDVIVMYDMAQSFTPEQVPRRSRRQASVRRGERSRSLS